MTENPPKPRRRWRRRRRKNALGIVDALAGTFKKLGLTDQAHRVRIYGAWRNAVGDAIAQRTMPFGFSRGVLTVKTKSAAWQNELTFMKQQLIDQLNEELGGKRVHDIKVISGSLDRPEEPPPPWLNQPLSRDDADAIEDAKQAIRDPELRELFGRAMRRDKQRRGG